MPSYLLRSTRSITSLISCLKKGLDRMYKLLLHLVDMKMYSSQAVTIYLLHPTPNMQLFVYIFIKNVHIYKK